MKRYLCILFLLFDCFIFRGDYVSAFGADRLVEAVYTGEGDFSTAYAYNANGNMTRDLNKGISNISYNLLTCREKLHSPMAGRSSVTNTNRGKIRTDFSVRPNPMAHEFGLPSVELDTITVTP